MEQEAERRKRRTVRRPGHHYEWRASYFVTIVTDRRFCWFGEIVSGAVVLNSMGEAVVREWLEGPRLRPGVALGPYVLMPNHLHAIVTLPGQAGGRLEPGGAAARDSRGWQQPALDRLGRRRVARDLGALVRGFKGAATTRAREIRQLDESWNLWQRNYHEHIIRDEDERLRIEQYIRANPSRWKFDSENVDARPDAFERSFWRDLDPFAAR